MYGALAYIAENFGINPVNIYRCKYYYVINSQNGSYSLSVARPSKDRIEKIHYHKELLCKNGFYLLDNYILSKEGKPYYEYEGNVYTLSRFFGNTELDITSNIPCMIALETIGSMHKAVKNAESTVVYAASLENTLIKSYEKQISALYKARKNIISNHKKDFDLKLSKYINPVIKKAETSLENLKKLGYGSQSTICHNSLKEGNIIYNKGKCRLIDWDNMKMAHYLEDAAFFMKRYMRKNAYYTQNTKAESANIKELYEKYVKYNKLDQNEEDILNELLNYPHRFVSLIIEYSGKNRGFVPSGLGNKLNECMEQWEFMYEYVNNR